MSDTIFSLQLSTRIPTWAAAPTALQTHYQRGRQQDFVPGMRVPRSGLPRVFVRALACISMQTPGGRCICTLLLDTSKAQLACVHGMHTRRGAAC
jgi:hypothetical protein